MGLKVKKWCVCSFPPYSIPRVLVRLNCLAWGLTLCRLIREPRLWCLRFLISTQHPVPLSVCHLTPSHRPPALHITARRPPLNELPHIWLTLLEFRSNPSPKFRLWKPSPSALSLSYCSLWGMYSCSPVTVSPFDKWGRMAVIWRASGSELLCVHMLLCHHT